MNRFSVVWQQPTLRVVLGLLAATVLINTAILGWFLIGLQQRNSQPAPSQTPSPTVPKVAVTIFPAADLVRQVAGEDVEVVQLLPSGANPHTFEPTPATMKELADAQVLFQIGHGLDDWTKPLAAAVGIERTFVLDRNIALREDHDNEATRSDADGKDPHYWLSPKNAQIMVQSIADELGTHFPEKSAAFHARATAYGKQLQELDQEITERLKKVPSPLRIATFHNAFSYYAADYNIAVVTTFEEFPGKEPSPQYVATFTRKLAADRIAVVFTEPQSSAQALEPFAKDLNVQLRELDDLGGTTKERDSYLNIVRFNTAQIEYAATQSANN